MGTWGSMFQEGGPQRSDSKIQVLPSKHLQNCKLHVVKAYKKSREQQLGVNMLIKHSFPHKLMRLVRQNLNFRSLQRRFLVTKPRSHLQWLGSYNLRIKQYLEIDQPSQRQKCRFDSSQFLMYQGDLPGCV